MSEFSKARDTVVPSGSRGQPQASATADASDELGGRGTDRARGPAKHTPSNATVGVCSIRGGDAPAQEETSARA